MRGCVAAYDIMVNISLDNCFFKLLAAGSLYGDWQSFTVPHTDVERHMVERHMMLLAFQEE